MNEQKQIIRVGGLNWVVTAEQLPAFELWKKQLEESEKN